MGNRHGVAITHKHLGITSIRRGILKWSRRTGHVMVAPVSGTKIDQRNGSARMSTSKRKRGSMIRVAMRAIALRIVN